MKYLQRDMHNGCGTHTHGQRHGYNRPKNNTTFDRSDLGSDARKMLVNGYGHSDDVSSDDSSSDSGDVVKACKRVQLERARSVPTDVGVPRGVCLNTGPVHGDWARKRKLVIHLDIRNTILVADSISDVTVEEALNSFLTGVVWGKVRNDKWVWHSSILSLKAPAEGYMTYYKYLERKLVKNCADRVKLRLQTGDFAQTPMGAFFQKHFDVHLARLSWQHDRETTRDKVLTMDGRNSKPYHYILPSVYKLIHHLTDTRRDFAIIIRTYGMDAGNVLSSLNFGLRGNHPAYPKPLNLPVNKIPGIIKRNSDDFELKTFRQGREQEVQQMLNHERDIYRFFSSSQGITGFVDDFIHWQKNNYDHAAGKPIWIDPSDYRHHHIFFDDNFRADDEDSILDVRLFNREYNGKAESLSHADVATLENVCLVQADLLESIADDNYFIHMVKKCEENYMRMIKSRKL